MAKQVCVTLGYGVEFYIDDVSGMGIQHIEAGRVTQDIPLGPATEKRLDIILLHIGSLRVYTERN